MNIQDDQFVLDARSEIIVKNLYLVNIVAKKYSFIEPTKFEDLLQEGKIGLIKAVDNYDISKKVDFKKFALYNIKYSIQDFLRKESAFIHISHNRLCDAYKLQRHMQKNSVTRTTPLSEMEMRGFLCCGKDYLSDVLFIIEILNNRNESVREDVSSIKHDGYNQCLKSNIFAYVRDLPLKQKIIMKGIYVENLSYRKLAKLLDVSHECVRKMHKKALESLRSMINNKGKRREIIEL